jgi:hypothetical protein
MKVSGFFQSISVLALACVAMGFSTGAWAAGTECKTRECLAEHAGRCEKSTYETPLVAGGQGRYEVFGPWQGNCAIDFFFLEHPDSKMVGPPIQFVVYMDEDIGPQLEEALAACLEGRISRYKCSGPIWEMAIQRDEVELRMASEPPCGIAVEDDGPPLYPLSRGGKWGYVSREGDWAIEPRWTFAEPFSEGRAVVADGNLWGVIDRQGNYTLEPVVKSATCVSSSGNPHSCISPLQPYSQGCSVADTQKDGSPHPFFVDRDGRFWLYDGNPQELSDKNLWKFGRFSGGRAWFQAMAPGLKESYGWIDSQGKVVLQDEFSGAGDFAEGMAPAASGGDNWALIDADGNPVMPRKWTLRRAKALSEGLAAVKIKSRRWMYFSAEGAIAIEKVVLDPPREVTGQTRTEAELRAAGDFHDGLAPIIPKEMYSASELIYIHPDGTEAFAPGSKLGVVVCQQSLLPEFRDGLVQLLVADSLEDCSNVMPNRALAEGDRARFIYLDTSGNIVLQESKSK